MKNLKRFMSSKMMSTCFKVMVIAIATISLGLTSIVTASAQEKAKIPTLVFVSGAVGGTWHPIAAAISEKAHQWMVGRPISVRPGAGGQGNPEVVAKGIADLGLSYGPFLILAARGEGPYKKKYTNLRSVMGLVVNYEQFLADKKLGLKTFDEILERKMKVRIGMGTPGSGDRFVLERILEAHGLTFKDCEDWGIRWESCGTTARVKAWQDRHIDVFNSFIMAPASQVNQAMHSREGDFLGLSAKTRNHLVEKWGLIDAPVRAGTYPSLKEDVPSITLPFMIFARVDVPEQAVYLLCKAAAENKKFLAAAVAAMGPWKPEEMHKGLGVELHPGAARYYRERGWIK